MSQCFLSAVHTVCLMSVHVYIYPSFVSSFLSLLFLLSLDLSPLSVNAFFFYAWDAWIILDSSTV